MNKLVKMAVAVAVALHIADAQAASYQLNDYSVTNLGRSYAGQGVVGDDYSAIAYNPAGMTLMKRSGVQQAFNMINVKSDVRGLDGYEGQKGKMNFWQPMPAGFAQYNVNDKFFLGGGIYAPFGLKTEYKSDWFGKEAAILSKLAIVDFNVSAAYKIDQHWSVGASAILRYIYGRMTQKLPMFNDVPPVGGGDINFNVDTWSKTAALGLMYEVDKNTRFGASWRLRSAQRAKGKFKMDGIQNEAVLAAMGYPYLKNGATDVRANPDLPETVTFSGYHRYKNLGFSGTARWTHWTSSFPDFTVYSESLGGQKTSYYKYKNSWTLAAGVDYYYCKNLTFRFGGAWDQSPNNGSARRTIRIPDSDRWWMSVGASYMKNNWQVDVGYAHLIAKTGKSFEDRGVGGSTPVHAKFKNTQSNILGVQVQYKF